MITQLDYEPCQYGLYAVRVIAPYLTLNEFYDWMRSCSMSIWCYQETLDMAGSPKSKPIPESYCPKSQDESRTRMRFFSFKVQEDDLMLIKMRWKVAHADH